MAIYHFPAIVTLHLIYQQLLHFSVPIRLKSHTNNCWDAYQKCNCQKSTTRRRRQRKRSSDQDTCSFFQLLPSQWNFHGRFGPLSTLEYVVQRQQWSKEILIYFFFFFSKTESIRRRRRSRREIALNGIHSRGPFTTLCYASRSWMNCEAQQAQKSLFRDVMRQ